jgi:hypothetical protein
MKNQPGVPAPIFETSPQSASLLDSSAHLQFSGASWAAVGDLTKWVGKNAASGIVGAAAGMLFQKFMDEVGLGGPDLVAQLDKISGQLTEVQRSLDRITAMTAEVLKQFDELRGFMEMSMKVENLLVAMNHIDVAYGRPDAALLSNSTTVRPISLRLLTEKMPHFKDVTQAYLTQAAQDFAEDVSDIPEHIDKICMVLVQAEFGQASLLQHWSRELVQHVLAKKITADSAYLVLEGYFLQAVSSQMKGLCVHGVALSIDQLAAQRIKQYLEDDFGNLMRKQIAAYLAVVDDFILATSTPIVVLGSPDKRERVYPPHVAPTLLRADLLCAVLNLIGKRPNATPAATPQEAIQGIYGRALYRPSNLLSGKAPVMNLQGYPPAQASTQYQSPFSCVDLHASAGKPTLSDVNVAKATMARYKWDFANPLPLVGTEIDSSFKGAVTPAMYPVFGTDQPMVLAAGLFDGSRLISGLASGTKPEASSAKFPVGNAHISYFDQQLICGRHALSDDEGTIFQSSFEVQNAWRANARETSYLKQRLFAYSGGRGKVRLSAHVRSRLSAAVRHDWSPNLYWHMYSLFHVLKLRFPDGTEKDIYDCSTAFDGKLDVYKGKLFAPVDFGSIPRVGDLVGIFSLDFDVVPGDYHLVLYNTVNFPYVSFVAYEGWNSTQVTFTLHDITLEVL